MVRAMTKAFWIIMSLALTLPLPGQEPGSDARALYDRGLEAIARAASRSELKVAARLLEEAKKADPGWAEVHFALGRVYGTLDVHDRAAESYEGYLELAAAAPDRDEVLQRVRACRQKQRWLEEDKKRMASGAWAKVLYLPPVRFDQPVVASRFRIDSKGRLFALNPWLEILDRSSSSWVNEKWLPVTFDGNRFEYQYLIYYKALNPARTEHMIETVRGEVIRGEPTKIRQEAWTRSSPTAYQPNQESLRGEVLHEVR